MAIIRSFSAKRSVEGYRNVPLEVELYTNVLRPEVPVADVLEGITTPTHGGALERHTVRTHTRASRHAAVSAPG